MLYCQLNNALTKEVREVNECYTITEQPQHSIDADLFTKLGHTIKPGGARNNLDS